MDSTASPYTPGRDSELGAIHLFPFQAATGDLRGRWSCCVFTGLVFVFLSLHAKAGPAFWIWVFSAYFAAVDAFNLVPFLTKTASSDGYKIWQAIRGGAAFDWVIRDLLTASSNATPLRVRDWLRDVVARLAEVPADPAVRRYNYYLAYIHFLDSGDNEKAGQYLDRLMADWTAGDPSEYALEAAYYYAFDRNDAGAARLWLAVGTKDAEPWVRLRAQAAMELASDNPEKARMLIDDALAALAASPACGAYRYEIDRLCHVRTAVVQEMICPPRTTVSR